MYGSEGLRMEEDVKGYEKGKALLTLYFLITERGRDHILEVSNNWFCLSHLLRTI